MTNLGTQEWLSDFRQRHGRSLRVLHIGNIANNGYRNAAIQRRIGIEADVVCYDYYHIMGTPEWEEAELPRSVSADMPDWWSVDLGDWKRPSWYVQGPLELCLQHLQQARRGNRKGLVETRIALVQAYADQLRQRADAPRRSAADVLSPELRATTARLAPELLAHSKKQWRSGLQHHVERAGSRLKRYSSISWRRTLEEQTASGLLDRALRGPKEDIRFRDRVVFHAYRAVQAATNRPLRTPVSVDYWQTDPTARSPFRLGARFAAGLLLWSSLQPVAMMRDRLRRPSELTISPPVVTLADPEEIDRLCAEYIALNGATPAELARTEIDAARAQADRWRDVLVHYDIVQGYSIDGLWPLLAGHPNPTAYEHGTIRDIPFDDSAQGRLCRFTYSKVKRAFITNSDVLPSADRIPIAPERRVCMPHAFDDSRLETFRATHGPQPRNTGEIVLFSPTRHHWQTPDPSLNKGNDILLRGAADAVGKGVQLRLKLVEWGQHLAQSRELIRTLGLAEVVEWLPIMNRSELWSAMMAAHAVADQFTLPALGGVGYESLTLGLRLVTNVDQPTLARFFGAAPPVLTAASPADVSRRICELAADPEDKAGLGQASALWARTYHSTQRVLDLQVSAYRQILV